FHKNPDVAIKISGCMNACGQHNMAHIGFQGMSVRTKDKLVAPALQVLLGGGNFGDGNGRFADKVAKIPSKRGPQALRLILDDFLANGQGLNFTDYYAQQGEPYFYEMLKPLTEVDNLVPEDFIDWGNEIKYQQAIGVGECAGVILDLVATLFLESQEKIDNAQLALEDGNWSASIYYSYQSMVNAAKALLTSEKVKVNTHVAIVKAFDQFYVQTGKVAVEGICEKWALQLNNNEPSEGFAKSYLQDARTVLQRLEAYRKLGLEHV